MARPAPIGPRDATPGLSGLRRQMVLALDWSLSGVSRAQSRAVDPVNKQEDVMNTGQLHQNDPGRTSEPLIAIVDDDASVGRSTRRLLCSTGLRAESFTSAEKFLESGHVEDAACLLLDMRMPEMDGLELQRRLLKAGRVIPIIFLSARASDEEERRARLAGAVNFLRKPVSKETLLQAIQLALKSTAQ